MILRALAILILLASSCAAWAQEQAFTNRSTELKDRGAPEARSVATLPENTAVKVLARGGGWTRVEALGQSGWVRVFHLRFPSTVETTSSTSTGGGLLSGIASAIGGGREKSQQTTIATTGVRGLSPEDLKNASPNPAALAKMQSYRADKPNAERFARDGKLASVSIDYVEDAPSKGGRR
jgi:hypothetical protein